VDVGAGERVPDWVNDTPPDNEYCLMIMSEFTTTTPQAIDLSRDEYIALKAHLAALRGYELDRNLEERLSQVSDEIKANFHSVLPELDQVVNGLQIAREMFERCPDLVMLKSETLDADLDAIHARAITAIPNRPEPV
jgi:hypothetical protein